LLQILKFVALQSEAIPDNFTRCCLKNPDLYALLVPAISTVPPTPYLKPSLHCRHQFPFLKYNIKSSALGSPFSVLRLLRTQRRLMQ
jgi:hypothetical protein